MKKRIALFSLTVLFGVGVATTSAFVLKDATAIYAEGEETSSSSSLVVEEESSSSSVATTEEEDKTPVVDEVKEWVDKFFGPTQVAMYMSWLAYIGTIIGLVANLKKLKQSNNLTLKNVSDEVQGKLEIIVNKEVADQFGKIAPKLVSGQEKSNKIMTIFAEILALSQENTPESRVAILNLIKELGVVGNEIVDTAKEVVEDSVKVAEETKKEMDKKLDAIVDNYDGTSI